MKLKAKMIHTGDLILVNRHNPYRENKKRLVSVCGKNKGVRLEEKVAGTLEMIMSELGCSEQITAVSGWRSKEEQEKIYHDSLCQNGTEFTKKYVAVPGHSEHQTGLAVDMAIAGHKTDFICPDFPYTGICEKFREKAAEFGLIERYPEGKEKITGIAHEPWHFRYVGRPHAIIMRQRGITLEEYLYMLRQNHSYGKPPMTCPQGSCDNKIFYIASEGEETTVEWSKPVFSVSGDNMGGFIITA